MVMKFGLAIPKRSIIISAGSACALLILIFALIIPAQKRLANLDRKISDLEYQNEEQQVLFPLYASLKSASGESVYSLPFPPRAKLSRAKAPQAPGDIRALAKASRLRAIAVNPDMATMAPASRSLLINATLRGSFSDFRGFLSRLGSLPCLEHIEEVRIKRLLETREFRIKIWLALDS